MPATQPSFIIVGGASSSGGSSSGGAPFREIPIGPLDGVNKTFRLSFTPWLGYVWLLRNGVDQSPFVPRFTLAGNVITYAVAPKSTDEHWCWYFKGPSALTNLRARSFAGGTDGIDWGNSVAFNLHGDMSLGIWVKFSSSTGFGNIFGRLLNGSNLQAENGAFGLAVSGASGNWSITYAHDHGSSGATDCDHTFLTAIPNDIWTYVGFSRDSVAQTVTLYLGDTSGVSAFSIFAYPTNPDGGTASDMHLRVGQDNGSTGSPWGPYTGDAQQHYIWNRVITQAEHLSAAQGNPSPTGLLLSCAMGTSPEIDSSGNRNSGVVTGTTLVQGHN